MKNKKVLLIILGVLCLIVVVSGITYAAISWASDPDSGYINLYSQCFDIDYLKGADITNKNIKMGDSYKDSGTFTEVQVNIKEECTILGTGTLYLTTDEDTSDVFIDDAILYYQVLEDGVEVSEGDIYTEGKIPIYEDIEVNHTPKILTIYIWADSGNITDDNVTEVLNSAIYSGRISFEAVGDRYE